LSTVSNFSGASDITHSLTITTETFTSLSGDTTYYAQVRAVNHSGIPTNFTNLGSTKTISNAGITRIWTGGTSSDWTIASNWNPNGAPQPLDSVVIPVTGRDPV